LNGQKKHLTVIRQVTVVVEVAGIEPASETVFTRAISGCSLWFEFPVMPRPKARVAVR